MPATPDKRGMRIAYIINSVEGGGAALPVPAVAGALRNCGADVKLFALTRRDGRALPAMVAAGLEPSVRNGGETDHVAALAWLDRSVAEFRPDIIWTSLTRATLLGQIVGARRRIPVVSWQHAAYLRPANRWLLRATRRLTSLWICDSASVTEFTGRELGIPPSRLATWPIFAADATAPHAQPWQVGEPLRVGSLGRLHPVKGYDVLLAALAPLTRCNQQFELTIGGAGDERERLLADAANAGLTNVTLAGFISDPRAFLAAQHLYVQPSHSEGFCVAAHEAMQAGLPIIGSRVGEMASSVVPGVTGLLVPPGDAAALLVALKQCFDDPASLHEMGVAARARLLEKFSAAHFQQRAAAIYQQLVELSRSSRSPGRPTIDRSA